MGFALVRNRARRSQAAARACGADSCHAQALEALEGPTRRESPLLFQRLALALLQVAVGAGLSAGAYALLRGGEENAFRTQFKDVAAHIIQSTTHRMEEHMAAAATLALFVSQSVNSSAYPNVTVSGFDEASAPALAKMDHLRSLRGG